MLYSYVFIAISLDADDGGDCVVVVVAAAASASASAAESSRCKGIYGCALRWKKSALLGCIKANEDCVVHRRQMTNNANDNDALRAWKVGILEKVFAVLRPTLDYLITIRFLGKPCHK